MLALSIVSGVAGFTLAPGRLQDVRGLQVDRGEPDGAQRHATVRAQGFPDLERGAGVPGIEAPPEPTPEEPNVQRGARLFGGLAGGTTGGAIWSIWDGAGLSSCSPFDPESCIPSQGSVLNRGDTAVSAPTKGLINAEDLPFGIGDMLKNPTSVLRACGESEPTCAPPWRTRSAPSQCFARTLQGPLQITVSCIAGTNIE